MNWRRHVMALELRKILAYRTDFWITFLGQTLIQLLVARALWQTIFASQGKSEMGGFTLERMSLYYLIVPVGMKILIGENIGFLAREIYEGTFTRYLLYPLSVFQYKIATYLTYSLFYTLQLCLLYFLFRLCVGTTPFTFFELGNLLLGLGLFLTAALTYVLLSLMVEMIAFWADNIWSLVVGVRFFTSFFGGGLIPLNFMPPWAQKILLWTPFPYMMSLPTRTIMGLTSTSEILQGFLVLLVWSLIFSTGVRLIWARGQNRYSGVGI